MAPPEGAPGEPTADILDGPEAGAAVVRGGLLRGAGFFAGTLCSLVGIIVVTRHLGPERFSDFQTVLNLLAVILVVTDMGMATLGLREYSQRDAGERERFLRVLLGLRLVLTAIGAGVAIAIVVVAGYEPALVAGAAAGAVGLLLQVGQTSLAIPLAAELRIAAVAALETSRQVLMALAYVALVAAGAGVLPLLAATVPVGLVILAWNVVLVRGRVPLLPAAAPREWAALLMTALSFALAVAVGTIYQYLAQILSGFVTTAYESGLFSASFRTFIVVAGVPSVLVASALPVLARAARDDHDRLSYAVSRLGAVMSVIGVAGAVAFIVGAEPIMLVIGGNEFTDAAPILRVHGIALALTFVITTWGFALISLHAHRTLILGNAAALLASVVLVLTLGPTYGGRGIVWATVVGEVLLGATYWAALRAHPSGAKPQLGTLAASVLAAAVAIGAVTLIDVAPVAATLLALAIYAALVLGARLLPAELLDLAPPRLRPFLKNWVR